jgi:hypothetical protein
VAKSFARSLDDCRFTFFSRDLPKGELIRYQRELAQCSPVRLLDLSALNKVGGAGRQAGRQAGGLMLGMGRWRWQRCVLGVR